MYKSKKLHSFEEKTTHCYDLRPDTNFFSRRAGKRLRRGQTNQVKESCKRNKESAYCIVQSGRNDKYKTTPATQMMVKARLEEKEVDFESCKVVV